MKENELPLRMKEVRVGGRGDQKSGQIGDGRKDENLGKANIAGGAARAEEGEAASVTSVTERAGEAGNIKGRKEEVERDGGNAESRAAQPLLRTCRTSAEEEKPAARWDGRF